MLSAYKRYTASSILSNSTVICSGIIFFIFSLRFILLLHFVPKYGVVIMLLQIVVLEEQITLLAMIQTPHFSNMFLTPSNHSPFTGPQRNKIFTRSFASEKSMFQYRLKAENISDPSCCCSSAICLDYMSCCGGSSHHWICCVFTQAQTIIDCGNKSMLVFSQFAIL